MVLDALDILHRRLRQLDRVLLLLHDLVVERLGRPQQQLLGPLQRRVPADGAVRNDVSGRVAQFWNAAVPVEEIEALREVERRNDLGRSAKRFDQGLGRAGAVLVREVGALDLGCAAGRFGQQPAERIKVKLVAAAEGAAGQPVDSGNRAVCAVSQRVVQVLFDLTHEAEGDLPLPVVFGGWVELDDLDAIAKHPDRRILQAELMPVTRHDLRHDADLRMGGADTLDQPREFVRSAHERPRVDRLAERSECRVDRAEQLRDPRGHGQRADHAAVCVNRRFGFMEREDDSVHFGDQAEEPFVLGSQPLPQGLIVKVHPPVAAIPFRNPLKLVRPDVNPDAMSVRQPSQLAEVLLALHVIQHVLSVVANGVRQLQVVDAVGRRSIDDRFEVFHVVVVSLPAADNEGGLCGPFRHDGHRSR